MASGVEILTGFDPVARRQQIDARTLANQQLMSQLASERASRQALQGVDFAQPEALQKAAGALAGAGNVQGAANFAGLAERVQAQKTLEAQRLAQVDRLKQDDKTKRVNELGSILHAVGSQWQINPQADVRPILQAKVNEALQRGDLSATEGKMLLEGASPEMLVQFGRQRMSPQQQEAIAGREAQLAEAKLRNAQMDEHRKAMEKLAQQRLSVNINNQGSNELTDEDMRFMAQQYLAGDNSVLQNLGRGVQGGRALQKLRGVIRQEAVSAGLSPQDVATKMADFQGTKAAMRTLGTRTAQLGLAGNEAYNMADVVLDTSRDFARTEFVPINKAYAAFQEGRGDPKVVEFGAAINGFVNAYARAISPTGQPTVSDKEHAREILNRAHTHQQVQGAINTLRKEIDAAHAAPAQTKREVQALARGEELARPATAATAESPRKATKRFNPATGMIEAIQ